MLIALLFLERSRLGKLVNLLMYLQQLVQSHPNTLSSSGIRHFGLSSFQKLRSLWNFTESTWQQTRSCMLSKVIKNERCKPTKIPDISGVSFLKVQTFEPLDLFQVFLSLVTDKCPRHLQDRLGRVQQGIDGQVEAAGLVSKAPAPWSGGNRAPEKRHFRSNKNDRFRPSHYSIQIIKDLSGRIWSPNPNFSNYGVWLEIQNKSKRIVERLSFSVCLLHLASSSHSCVCGSGAMRDADCFKYHVQMFINLIHGGNMMETVHFPAMLREWEGCDGIGPTWNCFPDDESSTIFNSSEFRAVGYQRTRDAG